MRREETEKILSQFRALTTGQQEEQRQTWAEELKLVKTLTTETDVGFNFINTICTAQTHSRSTPSLREAFLWHKIWV